VGHWHSNEADAATAAEDEVDGGVQGSGGGHPRLVDHDQDLRADVRDPAGDRTGLSALAGSRIPVMA